jgi:hypothetical protein
MHRYQVALVDLHASTPPAKNTETSYANLNDFASPEKRFQFFLRFSPLIGGPSFLPLHVEVILVPVIDRITVVEHGIETALNPAPNSEYFDIHRFDFLPENPREPATIVRLMQLQAVPGLVRYRCSPALQTDDNKPETTSFQLDNRGDSGNQGEERGVTILFNLGISSSRKKSTSSTSVLTTAMDFINSYKTTHGRELRILGGKNCVSFALDMLSHIDDAHGIDVKLSLPKMF